ncbi:MAG: YggS family pyridoxal phosphate enzyme, partial [Planctomycetota bacterium]|nr:YggS family pyridoxal phosphate enzyme [Planctomycetota bacterium]
MESPLEGNLARVRSRIASAARLAGRTPEDVRLVAVTKSVAPAVAEALARLGQVELGENRVDLLAE